MSLTSRAYASETPGFLMMQHYQRLAVAAQILLWTTGFSLILSVTMVVVMYMRRKRLSEARVWPRRELIASLLANSLLALGSTVFFAFSHCVDRHRETLVRSGTGLEPSHPLYGAAGLDKTHPFGRGMWMTRDEWHPDPWQLSSFLIFLLSVVLLLSAWMDSRDEMDRLHVRAEKNFGEKGEIHL
ncbi:hypothetical protein LQW54_010099 [Pestalotiopsis sp. IQ-011]